MGLLAKGKCELKIANIDSCMHATLKTIITLLPQIISAFNLQHNKMFTLENNTLYSTCAISPSKNLNVATKMVLNS